MHWLLTSMDWLFWIVVGWIGKKLKSLVEWAIGVIWLFSRATPAQRCYFVISLYIVLIKHVLILKDKGAFKDRHVPAWIKRFDRWVNPRLTAWRDRVRTA